MVKNLKFSIILCGHCENDVAWNSACQNTATYHDQGKKRDWASYPTFCILIDHPEKGLILYDVGPGLGDEAGRRGEAMSENFPLFIEREEFVDEQLRRAGYELNDISTIILSHTHWDHYGGIGFFTGTKAADNVYVPRRDFEFGLAETHARADGESTAYVKEDFETPGINYTFMDKDFLFAEGMEIIIRQGHTPAVASLLLECEDHVYLFTNDTVSSALNYGPPLIHSGIVYDTLGVVETVEEFREIERRRKAKLIFSHDMEQMNRLEKLPYWYQ